MIMKRSLPIRAARVSRCLAVVAVAALAPLRGAHATVAVSPLFSSHMVLQRDRPLPVSGTAGAGRVVTVTFNGQSVGATADAAGAWRLELGPMAAKAAGGTFTVAEGGGNTLTFTDVVVGDVWVCSGQSNMAFSLGGCERPADVSGANFPGIRHFWVPLANRGEPSDELTGSWQVCSPSTAAGFSAVAFYFGRAIHQDQAGAVPVGLVASTVGGTCIDPWLAPEGACDIPALQPLYGQSILAWGPFSLFNGMIHPLAVYQVKGAIWYQGENRETTNQTPDSYFLKEKALQQGWRRLWGADEFPFYVVQLANWLDPPTTATPDGWGTWADTRLQQAMVLGLPKGGVASALDVGDAADIHPKDKLDVGERLARWALRDEYGRTGLVPCGPVLRDAALSGATIVCSFDHVGAGLMVGSKTPWQPTEEVVGGTLQRFSIAGSGGVWHAADAVISGDTVAVSSPSVPAPRKVAYACWTNPQGANLYNRDGLPASPFLVEDVTVKRTITASAGGGGTVSPAGATTFLERATALYTITPDPGMHIADVTVDGASVGAVRHYTFDPLHADHAIHATFTASRPNHTINASAGGGGTITPSGAVGVAQGGSQAFAIAASPGATAAVAADGCPMGARKRFAFADVRDDHTITASFSYTINAAAGYGGTISPSGASVVGHGGSITYQITPAAGYSILKVLVDGVNVGTPASHTFSGVDAGHTISASFTGGAGGGSVPRAGDLLFSCLADNLPAAGAITSWPTYLPAGQSLAKIGSPTVETVDGRRFSSNNHYDGDGFDQGNHAAPIACEGASIVVAVKPERNGVAASWTSIVDVFYNQLVLGLRNDTGKVCVWRKGSLDESAAAIPDGQTTILSLVGQADGSYKVWANGTEVMSVGPAGTLTSLPPGGAGAFATHVTVGRNWPDGWTTFNGLIGDVFFYKVALVAAERQSLEQYIATRLVGGGGNSPPGVSAVDDQQVAPGGSTGPLAFTVNDAETPAAELVVTAASSNQAVVPDSNILLGGSGPGRSVTVTSAAGVTGVATVTLTVTDGGSATADTSFVVSSKHPATVTLGNLEHVHDGTPKAASVSTTPPGLPVVVTYDGSTTPPSDTGSYAVVATVDDPAYQGVATGTLVITSGGGAGRVIGINVGANGAIGASDTAGVVPADHWNDLTGASNPAASNLADADGVATTLDVAFTGNGNTFNNNGTPDQTMLSGFLVGATMRVDLTEVPFEEYDVYVYYAGFGGDVHAGDTYGMYPLVWEVTDLDAAALLETAYSARGTVAGPQFFPSPGLVQSQYGTLAEAQAQALLGNGGNWLRLAGLTAANLRIAETGGGWFNEAGFSGLQVVEATGPEDTYATWIAGFPAVGARTGFADDPDGDGIGNGVECWLGSDPGAADAGLTPVTATASGVTFTHTAGNAVPGDVTAGYEWSPDLASWYPNGSGNGAGVSVTISEDARVDNEAPDNDLVTATATVTAGRADTLFVRVAATQAL